ncbi:MAG TPA: universal stress protein [Bryobacteraceae bacterium]
MLIKHILFPVDFSPRCCEAAAYVKTIAARFGAKVTLISAAPFSYAAMGYPELPVVLDTDELLRDLKERLNSALVTEFAGLQVERVAEVGDPAQIITNFARSSKVDLIMMPTRGYGPFRSLLLGSTTAKVLHDAECPVWTAAHIENPPKDGHVTPRAILCAVDQTDNSEGLIKYAAQLADEIEATIRLVHVVPGFATGAARQADQEFEEYMRMQAHKTVETLQKKAGLEAPLCVTVGDIAAGIREEAQRHAADLVVIGRGVLHEKLGRLRTHGYGIIRRSPCPVLSV